MGIPQNLLERTECKMKKIISAALCLIMIAAMALPSFAANYAGNLDFSLTNAAGKQNEEITVELKLNENPGMYGFFIVIYYDSDTFIMRDIEFDGELTEFGEFEPTKMNLSMDELKGPILKNLPDAMRDYGIEPEDKNFKALMFNAYGLDEDTDFTGTVAKITFQIMGIAEDGDYTIGIMPCEGNFINAASEDLSVTWTNATVHVGDSTVPEVTQESRSLEDTEKTPVTTAESENPDDPIKPVDSETENASPVTDEKGETVEPAETTDTDVSGEDTKKEQTTMNVFGQKIPVVYFIIVILLILVAIAAILFVILSKSKKKKQ